MNNIEKTLLEQMEKRKFHDTITDDFEFADSLIDQNDNMEVNTNEDD